MHSRHAVRSVLEHDHRLLEFGVPLDRLLYDMIGDHVRATGVLVPAVVSIETDHVQMSGGLIFLWIRVASGRDRAQRIQRTCEVRHLTSQSNIQFVY